MSKKNDTAVTIISLAISLAIIGGLGWWLTRKNNLFGLLPSQSPSQTSNTATNQTSPSSSNAASQSGPQVATFSQVDGVPQGLFNYGGSTTWAPIRDVVDPQIQTVYPEFRLRYTQHPTQPPGSGTGIRMLIDGELAFSQSSRPIQDAEYQQAEQRGFQLEQIPVALDGIAVAVNHDLQIPGLTVAQVRDIFTGDITNWQEVGGIDQPIQPYSRSPEDSGTVKFFLENVLQGESFGSNVEFISTTTEALRAVSNNVGSIYFASAPEVVPQCSVRSLPLARPQQEFVPPYVEPAVSPANCPQERNQLNDAAFQDGSYPITRRLFVIVKRNGQVDERAGDAYVRLLLSEQGQQAIQKAGFVRIR
ncbi:PstS family phosphate ABC transporter substrate-binding protein [Geitlerinema sp. PCC 9228]|jgi:phosphate transport system substrate-binding protein|uniref:PstS family phosphate ABC transporter substrate-binding protein n=1 Tax=Geitlerinema sp. PCC 9228 TaxID=111611 RepID=UPI0008F9A7F4|nr:PstS family phosphate ABC transporter substrate-binding protein [Geitlerinema sp. PCC 9228]